MRETVERLGAGLLIAIVAAATGALLLAQNTVSVNPRVTGAQGTNITVGTGGATATIGGTLATFWVSGANVMVNDGAGTRILAGSQPCTTAVTTEETLLTWPLVANTLDADGRGLEVMAFGTFAANANAKTAQFYWNSAVIGTTAAQTINNGVWRFDLQILRTAAAAQAGHVYVSHGVTASSVATFRGNFISPTADTTTAIPIKVTGTNGTASANDLCLRGGTVKILR